MMKTNPDYPCDPSHHFSDQDFKRLTFGSVHPAPKFPLVEEGVELGRLLYIRHANDFVILLTCDQATAYTIKRTVKDFLKNKLGIELDMDKTSVCNIKKGFKFLGADIGRKTQVVKEVSKETGKNIHPPG